MCLVPTDRRAFVEWLHSQEGYSAGLDEKGHMPRAVYGEFLSDVVARARREATERGIDIRFLDCEALDIEEPADGGVIVTYADGTVSADMVIVATGRCPGRDVLDNGGKRRDWFFPTHMPGTNLDRLPLDAGVYILGASLSAYDVVNQLFSPATGCDFVEAGHNRLEYIANGNDRRVVLCSRSGRLKKIQSRSPSSIERQHFNADVVNGFRERSVTLEQVLDLMMRDADVNGAPIDRHALTDPYDSCDSLDAVTQRAAKILASDIDAAAAPADSTANFIVDYLDQAQFDIWDLFATHRLTEDAEATYRSRYETALLSYAAPCPSSTAQKLLALMRSGRLRMISGVRSIEPHSDGADIHHSFGKESAEYLINATGGVDRNVRSARQPDLIRNLVRRGMLQPYVRGRAEVEGAAVDMSTFRCEGSDNIYFANMFLWGPGFFVSAAITMATIVDRLLRSAFEARRI